MRCWPFWNHNLQLLAAVSVAVAIGLGGATAGGKIDNWTSLQHPHRGFMIAYPASVFTPRNNNTDEDGLVLESRDGNARLLVGTFENSADFTLQAYRDYLVENSYSGAKFDYEKMRERWFVISGTRDGTMFYERVSFTCGGKLVNSWAMLYPVADRRFYDRIVEAIAPTYVPGAGATGQCD